MPWKKPTNKIVVAGTPLIEECKIETVANCYPGRLVKKGSSDAQIVVNTAAGMACGWLGYEMAHDDYKPATVDTIYVVNDFIPVLKGRFILVGRLANGQNVAKGAPLVAAAAGELTAATAATITIATGATAVLSDKAQPDEAVVGAYGDQGLIVAIAEESVDASGGAADIMVQSLI